jgi:hypothetical protein
MGFDPKGSLASQCRRIELGTVIRIGFRGRCALHVLIEYIAQALFVAVPWCQVQPGE